MNDIQNPQEIHEAINAADDALAALRNAEKSLSSAGGWGIWDMLGGGFFSSLMKHSRIEDAQRDLEAARRALARFKNELADLGRVAEINLDMGNLLRFADYFFDNIFSDMMVQSKIREGQRQLSQAIDRVEEVRRRLWAMLG